MPSRREILLLIGATLTSCSYGHDKHKTRHLTKLLEELSLIKWAVIIGKDLYRQDPQLSNFRSIVTLFDHHFPNPATNSLNEFKKRMRAQIENDFQSNKTTSYQGWVLSQKESALYVMAFLYSESASVTKIHKATQ